MRTDQYFSAIKTSLVKACDNAFTVAFRPSRLANRLSDE